MKKHVESQYCQIQPTNSTLEARDREETQRLQLQQRPMHVPRINKTFIEWVTDYACLNKNDDIFGVFPTTDGLQESRNVFALMQKKL